MINRSAAARGNPADWITDADYPPDALNAGAQGTVTVAWDIGVSGRVENCHTVSSSGNSSLDRAACSALTRHGRYTAALDQTGNPIRQPGQTRRVTWRVPE